MNKRERITQEPVEEIVETPFEVGKLVTFYWNGWRTGTVEELTKTTAKIRPSQAHKRLLTVDVNDLRTIKQ